jgi:hypothetical protein
MGEGRPSPHLLALSDMNVPARSAREAGQRSGKGLYLSRTISFTTSRLAMHCKANVTFRDQRFHPEYNETRPNISIIV